jgi:hypothetical protein
MELSQFSFYRKTVFITLACQPIFLSPVGGFWIKHHEKPPRRKEKHLMVCGNANWYVQIVGCC